MLEKLNAELNSFLDEIFTFVDELNIDVSDFEIDHVALRFKSSTVVDKLASELGNHAEILSQAIVNGRKIYIFKLNSPFIYKNYSISCVELPYPAFDHDYPNDGWEHIEFVLPCENIDKFEEEFKSKFPNLTDELLQKYNFKTSLPQVEGDQLPNPTVILTKYKGLAIKFHPYSIEKVVTSN